MFMVAIKLNPLHSLGLMAQAELTYSLRRGIKILAFPLKPWFFGYFFIKEKVTNHNLEIYAEN